MAKSKNISKLPEIEAGEKIIIAHQALKDNCYSENAENILGTAINQLSYALINKLGKDTFHLTSDETVWNSVDDFLNSASELNVDIESQTIELISFVNDRLKETHLSILSNHLIKLPPNIDLIDMGFVKISRRNAIEETINSSNAKILVFDGFEDGVSFRNFEKKSGTLSDFVWIIKAQGATETVVQESIWLIEIATSILRLTQMFEGNIDDTDGMLEGDPLNNNYPITFFAKSESPSNWKPLAMPYTYILSSSANNSCNSQEFKKLCELIFNPPKSTLAKLVSNGIGWLTKARRMQQRSERLLMFFTAIEAVLSPTDKTQVTETISRNISTLLSEDANDRFLIAKRIKELYNTRSKIVHLGIRSVSQREVQNIQHYAERFYMYLLRHDLSQSQDSFREKLYYSSFGHKF